MSLPFRPCAMRRGTPLSMLGPRTLRSPRSFRGATQPLPVCHAKGYPTEHVRQRKQWKYHPPFRAHPRPPPGFSSGSRPPSPTLTHADRRSTDTAHRLLTHHGQSFWLNTAGNLPYPGSIGASTLAHLKKTTPTIFRAGYRVGQTSTLVGHALTSRFTIDPS